MVDSFREGCGKYAGKNIFESSDTNVILYNKNRVIIRYVRISQEYLVLIDEKAQLGDDDMKVIKPEELQLLVKAFKLKGRKEVVGELEKLTDSVEAEKTSN